MLGFGAKGWLHSGAGTMCPGIELGEPMAEDAAEGPDAVEYAEVVARRSGDSWGY